jgi:soluble lytic murein transglycosylase
MTALQIKRIIAIVLILVPLSGNLFAADSNQDIHKSILSSMDSGNYADTVRLLVKLKQEDPIRYAELPYALLHAHMLALTNNFKEAYAVYQSMVSDPRLAPFVLLPLARIAAKQGIMNMAAQHYQEYLSHAYPEYNSVAREALNYCWQQKRADLLYATAQVVQKKSTLDRLAQLYLGRSYLLSGDRELARNLFLTLIAYHKKDDVTNLALSELDVLEGTQISSLEKQRRGKLAYDVWNFELARKYLGPVANQSMENGFYYARTLFFLGDLENSRKAFQATLAAWPNDPKYSDCLYQYANVYFREGNYEKASQLYQELRSSARGEMQDTAAFKMIYALRAQSRFDEAVAALGPYAKSRDWKRRGKALSLRGRIYFQTGRYQDAYSDFHQALLLKHLRNDRELILWKALTLEKLKRSSEARTLFASIADGFDFYSQVAQERIASSKKTPEGRLSANMKLPQLPGIKQEDEIISMYSGGNPIPALLYLHLYDEASQQLPDFSRETWTLLGVHETNRLERFLAIAFLAGLGGNYSTSTYYAELFLKNLPSGVSIFSFPPEILKALFPLPYENIVNRFSKERALDPFLVLSIMKQESKFKPYARSQTFARGLMQIIPSTASSLASALNLQDFSLEQLYRPDVNINLGTQYVQDIAREFGNQLELIAAGYNGGERNVRRWRDCSIPGDILDFVSSIDFKETKAYVMIVKTNYDLYRRIYGGSFSSGLIGSSSQR